MKNYYKTFHIFHRSDNNIKPNLIIKNITSNYILKVKNTKPQ